MNDQKALLLQEKSVALCLVLSFVTFGIYGIVWMFGVMKKIKLLSGEEPKCGGELALFIFIPFYSLYWMYSRSKKLSEAGAKCGVSIDDKSVINLVLAIFGLGIVSFALIQSDLNNAAKAFQTAGAPA
jgi:hypothetical protein